MGIADSKSVENVRKALQDAGLSDEVIELEEPAESPADLARMVDADVGAIAAVQVYAIAKRMVLVIVAGDHGVVAENLGPALNLKGDAAEATDADTRGLTGYTADCMPPAGWRHAIPVVLDHSLKRFETLYALAGDPQCAFPISMDGLKRLTGGIVSRNIAKPLDGEIAPPAIHRNRTFSGEREVPGVDGE
ncbi:MAG: hypothetical protein HN377_06185 [Alphaproteobacteria bacterium]|jgi:prolyl-tRNA editing enzyme YbaK/EbsC (Cys-tRNA(Pro) deacylase)|nr:hypothetical protein [Alphaproteobacteria bacterium]MBT7943874.1 hypothetical protein [Alphaproteobacteria bacterium]